MNKHIDAFNIARRVSSLMIVMRAKVQVAAPAR
jgi:hypothetical protein